MRSLRIRSRIRDNLRALPKNTDPYQRQLTKFDELETQIEQQRAQLEAARKTEEQKHKALESYLLALNVE